MRLSSLTESELICRLSNGGLSLHVGPFVVNIKSTIPGIVQGIRHLYSEYKIEEPGFADFHVAMKRPGNMRRWFRPQVEFYFDNRVPFKPLPLSQAFPVFEWGLNWCVAKYGNQFLILHAAVLEKNGRAVIMPGAPGAGKSTLCAALALSGWRLLSDEMALISLKDGSVMPIPRPVSLKNESIQVIQQFSSKAEIGPDAADTVKGVVAHMKVPTDSIEQAHTKAKPALLVCPQYQANASSSMVSKPKRETFINVIQNAFNYSLLGKDGFLTAGNLVDACDCYTFTYSDLSDAIQIFDSLFSDSK